jgi:hypothetical protein
VKPPQDETEDQVHSCSGDDPARRRPRRSIIWGSWIPVWLISLLIQMSLPLARVLPSFHDNSGTVPGYVCVFCYHPIARGLSGFLVIACLHNQEKPGPSVFILREGGGPKSFRSCEPIKVGGEFVSGFSPHYNPHTDELFLMGIGPGKGEPVGFIFKVRVPDLCR